MGVVIGVLRSPDPTERRVPLVPDVAKKLRAQGAEIMMQRGASAGASIPEGDYPEVTWVDTEQEVTARANMLWTVGPLAPDTLKSLQPGTVVIGLLQPYGSAERAQALAGGRITSFAMELLPRISRAQSMDILSSQGACSGYQCVLIAAAFSPKFFPMLTYAAGTIRPARVLVIGAGVAGLQAIATARRLGAMVEGYDVRPETREQVESLGAKFVDTGVSAAGTGGYARELTDDEKRQQADKLGKAVAMADVLITTAAVPGKKAPLIITDAMVRGMKDGAVVVDMAAETGGNVAGTVPNQEVQVGSVRIIGPVNLPSNMPVSSSEMFARNLFNFIGPFIKDGVLTLDDTDEVLTGATLTANGEVKHAGVKQVLGL
jgi:NAD(P) transhydrogenase subunit alpha